MYSPGRHSGMDQKYFLRGGGSSHISISCTPPPRTENGMNLSYQEGPHSGPQRRGTTLRRARCSMFLRDTMPRLKSRKPLVLIAIAALVTAGIRLLYPLVGSPLVFNFTDSEPHGVYWKAPARDAAFRRGQLVVFPVPAAFRSLVYGRGWAAPGLPMMKGIGALEGDQVCISDFQATING